MKISRRTFLKRSAQAGAAAALMLAFPLAASAGSREEENGLEEVTIKTPSTEDGYLRVTLDTVSRSAYQDNPASSLVMLGFTVTNRTGSPVWLYHVHGNAFGQYEDGSSTIGGSFGGQAFKAQITRNDQMAQSEQTSEDGSGVCVSYGVNPGQTIQVSATGSMSSEAGTLTLTFSPPEQTGPNEGVHNSVYTFEVEFPHKCTSDSLQMAY